MSTWSTFRRIVTGTALATVVLAGGPSGPPTASAAASKLVRYVAVSVATVWASPSAPRAIDRPVLRNPADVLGWNRGLNTDARLGLVGRIVTQALLGEPVRVLGERGSWTRIAVIGQPTPMNRIGYPGWIPTGQLTSSPSFGARLSGPIAVVTAPTAMMRGEARPLEVSFGTELPAIGRAGGEVVVATPTGPSATLPGPAVRVYPSATAIPTPTRGQLVATARLFLGLRYLWGGTSAFGFDCSGFVSLIYRAYGIVIPRDSGAQALAGRPAARRALEPGDLVFFATDPPSRAITHVAMYIGAGQMIESPNSSSAVRIVPLAARESEYVTARRYLSGG